MCTSLRCHRKRGIQLVWMEIQVGANTSHTNSTLSPHNLYLDSNTII
ncbi:hypothetical protein BN903_50 [Halorubrum sp. AJ67]|nr:hypothetical protein BN903_50 [Halorubrum sp. AJ67]